MIYMEGDQFPDFMSLALQLSDSNYSLHQLEAL